MLCDSLHYCSAALYFQARDLLSEIVITLLLFRKHVPRLDRREMLNTIQPGKFHCSALRLILSSRVNFTIQAIENPRKKERDTPSNKLL